MGSVGNSIDTTSSYTVDYSPRTRGQITRYEAGVLYKAVKNGSVTTRPELTSQLYDETTDSIKFAGMRYTRDARYYDRIEDMTRALLNNDYKRAQMIINEIEEDNIRRAGKKSRWYKYR